MAELIWSIIAVAGGILLIVVILWSLATGRGDRDREEAARVTSTSTVAGPTSRPDRLVRLAGPIANLRVRAYTQHRAPMV